MQPSSDQNTGGSAGSPLRRYGPVAAIVVVIAVVLGFVLTSGDDDDDAATGDTTSSSSPDDTGGPLERPEGAISFSMAQEQGLDVTFPDTCDLERGTVAIPYFFAPECYADVDDNGGATSPGVTGDTITVVYYSAPANDPVLDFITGPIKNDDTPEQVQDTVLGFADLFGSYYQTYGRKVEVKIVNASGTSTDEVAARADAQKAIEQYKPFAAWGGPVLTTAWADEMAAAGVVCISCGSTGGEAYRDERAPYLIGIGMAGDQINTHGAEYIGKKLAGGKAEFSGDFTDVERTFGLLYISSSEESDKSADAFVAKLGDQGVDIAERVSYVLDPGRLPEQATSAISKMKAAGVTSVIIQADPVAPANFTQEATTQEYFPEWIVIGGTLVDTNVFGRVFDQAQWTHAFGITAGAVKTAPKLDPGFGLYEWFTGEEPPAAETAPILYPTPSLFFSVLQTAGPNLTPETFRDGLFSGAPTRNAITKSSLSWGDHGLWPDAAVETDWSGVDDATEWWWDAAASGPDEIQREGTGLMRFVEGGRRYLPGAWDSTMKLFQEEGSVTILETAPADETPPDYPSPAG